VRSGVFIDSHFLGGECSKSIPFNAMAVE
jgi:hypothetical protein